MPAVASRGSRKRRTVNEINMVPFIDVMLVLLIIFMVTAPMLTPGAINVPSAGKSSKPPAQVAHVLLDKDGSIRLKTSQNEQTLTLNDLGVAASSWQAEQGEESAVMLQADKTLSYEAVMNAMSKLHAAGVKRVALGVTSSSH